MAAANKFNAFSENLAEKVHNLQADSLKYMLTNTLPVATNALKSDIAEIAAGNGYTAGGAAITVTSSAQTAGVEKLVVADVVITAAGGSIGPFRYVVMYNDTPTSPLDPLIMWWDYGVAITLLDAETLTIDADPTTGILTIT